jgi:tRNA threonylcarbamoyladenosine modification (KEOPS) complex  Pcc1 subunit
MAVYKFPGTQVNAQFIDPSLSQFCDIFYENEVGTKGIIMGSVNAGTSYSGSLFEVGQEGMTGAFYGILSAQQNFVGRHPYQKVHKLLHRLSAEQDVFALDSFDYESPVQFSLISKPSDHSSCIDYDGIVFIDVFKDDLRPYQIDANYAMVYVVPPMGDLYSTQNDFLRAIEATAENIVKAVMSYNKGYTNNKSPNGLNLKKINTIRVCLFSGGYFNTFQLSHDQIASYIYQGIVNELHSKETSISSIQFENNYYDVMENEIKSKKQDFSIVSSLIQN